jgi:hypothetical protein
MLAYATKDSWLPVVEGWFNGGGIEENSGAGAWGSTTLAWRAADASQVVISGMSPNGHHGNDSRPYEGRCRDAAGNTRYRSGTISAPYGNNVYTPYIFGLCNPGEAAIHFIFNARLEFGGSKTLIRSWTPDLHQQTTTVNCRKVDTGAVQSFTDTETGHPERVTVPSCEERWPGSVPDGYTVTGGQTGVPPSTLLDVDVSPDVYEDYGDCFNELGLVCEIRVFIEGQPCSPADPRCHDWQQTHQNFPDLVKCKFGPFVVDIDNCTPLKRAYEPNAIPTEITDPAGYPDPTLDPDGNPNPNPNPNPDPTPSPTPTPTPNPSPTPFPTAGPNPESPTPTPGPDTNPDSRSCFGDAWSINPVDWVYVPVKCVFLWAFIPDPGFFDAKFGELKDLFGRTSPGLFIGSIDSLVPSAGATAGCAGPSFDISILDVDKTIRPLNACSGGAANAAGICHALLTVGLSIFGALACLRGIGSGLGWNVSLGRGADA